MKFGKWTVHAKGKLHDLPDDVKHNLAAAQVPQDAEIIVFAVQGGYCWVPADSKPEEYAQ